MPIPLHIAAAKREHAYRTRLAGLITLLLAFSLIILPTFKSQIPGNSSDYRLLSFLGICSRKPDDCPNDKNKEKAGFCGCGIPDTDTDGDGTPDCRDKCPNDAGKASPGACGCGTVDTYTDSDKDDILDCIDSCIDNDPIIQAICDKDFPGDECGCAEQYINVRHECGEQCVSGISYCLNVVIEKKLAYDKDSQSYYRRAGVVSVIQSGDDSSKTTWTYSYECDVDDECTFTEFDYVNGIQCLYTDDEMGECLSCEDENEYCYVKGVESSPDNVMYIMGNAEAHNMYTSCFPKPATTTSALESANSLHIPEPQDLPAFFKHTA